MLAHPVGAANVHGIVWLAVIVTTLADATPSVVLPPESKQVRAASFVALTPAVPPDVAPEDVGAAALATAFTVNPGALMFPVAATVVGVRAAESPIAVEEVACITCPAVPQAGSASGLTKTVCVLPVSTDSMIPTIALPQVGRE